MQMPTMTGEMIRGTTAMEFVKCFFAWLTAIDLALIAGYVLTAVFCATAQMPLLILLACFTVGGILFAVGAAVSMTADRSVVDGIAKRPEEGE